MRWIIRLTTLMGILLCAAWAGFGFVWKTGIQNWLETQRAAGWQAEAGPIRQRGFPLRVQMDLPDLALADTRAGLSVALDALSFSAPTYWPGDLTLSLPQTPISIATPQDKFELTVHEGHADLRLHPGPALQLERMGFTSNDWALEAAQGILYAGDDLHVTFDQSPADPTSYTYHAQAQELRPGAVTRDTLKLPSDWPIAFDTFEAEGSLRFDVPWDLQAVGTRRPQPRAIHLKRAEAKWSDLRILIAADLDVDAQGVPTGTVNLQAENWPRMLDLAVDAGLLPTQLRAQAQDSLNLLAGFSGDPNALDVQLNLRGGFMAVGFIPIGPAPRLILR